MTAPLPHGLLDTLSAGMPQARHPFVDVLLQVSSPCSRQLWCDPLHLTTCLSVIATVLPGFCTQLARHKTFFMHLWRKSVCGQAPWFCLPGQYAYAGYMPNKPTFVSKTIPARASDREKVSIGGGHVASVAFVTNGGAKR